MTPFNRRLFKTLETSRYHGWVQSEGANRCRWQSEY